MFDECDYFDSGDDYDRYEEEQVFRDEEGEFDSDEFLDAVEESSWRDDYDYDRYDRNRGFDNEDDYEY